MLQGLRVQKLGQIMSLDLLRVWEPQKQDYGSQLKMGDQRKWIWLVSMALDITAQCCCLEAHHKWFWKTLHLFL